jgi:hypothetical protein
MSTEKLKEERVNILSEEFFKDFPSLELPALDNITEIDEALRQHLFAEWLKVDHAKFNELREKFNEIYNVDEKIIRQVFIDPSNLNKVKEAIGEVIDNVQFNKTDVMHLVIPYKLKQALFEGWSDRDYNFVQMLVHYCELFIFETSQQFLQWHFSHSESLKNQPDRDFGEYKLHLPAADATEEPQEALKWIHL